MLPSREDYAHEQEIAGPFENQILYRMCLEHPEHVDSYIIRGKLLIISRTYAAPISWNAGKPKPGGPTFFEHVSKRFAASKLDAHLAKLPDDGRINDKLVLKKVIECHEYLVNLIKKSTESWKCDERDTNWKAAAHGSFASKYLHFHKPNAFPLTDSNANEGLKCEGLKKAVGNYEKFCTQISAFSERKSKDWTPRSIDMELTAIGKESLMKKEKDKEKKKS